MPNAGPARAPLAVSPASCVVPSGSSMCSRAPPTSPPAVTASLPRLSSLSVARATGMEARPAGLPHAAPAITRTRRAARRTPRVYPGAGAPLWCGMLSDAPLHSVARSRVEMTEHVLPEFSNSLGNIFGGQIAGWIDICAAIAAQRHCRSVVVTAAIDALQFLLPIRQGHIVILRGQVNATFRTSMECGVSVWSEDPLTGEVNKAMKAYATFVALDAHGKPTSVPALILETDEDRRRAREALARRQARLAQRPTSA